jgi:hypothetical protein
MQARYSHVLVAHSARLTSFSMSTTSRAPALSHAGAFAPLPKNQAKDGQASGTPSTYPPIGDVMNCLAWVLIHDRISGASG